ncbi:hypothetical protein Bequi_09940 [Brachybacterium sp. JHP9]|uniref:Uncharacterized protein n=1 Tax=Brachybacterium equifaecis TaxID=2910770 RepID=A0ABT0R196_9MICO|nr:hypothetical protein [Brachybacterium equifaecis]MCL6423704.1 hypothetical protein [Brachybacterium equifaecis]
MTTPEHHEHEEHEITARIRAFRTLATMEAAKAELPEQTEKPQVLLTIGINGIASDGAAVADVDIAGLTDTQAVRGLVALLHALQHSLMQDAEGLVEGLLDLEFRGMTAGDPAPQGHQGTGDASDPDVAFDHSAIHPSWPSMGDIDRALALEYLEELRSTSQLSDTPPSGGATLAYEQSPMLRALPPEYAHAHAMTLESEFRLLETIRRSERQRLEKALARHRAQQRHLAGTRKEKNR